MSEPLDENTIIKTIAERIRTERLIRKLSQEDLAEKTGMTQPKISKLERAEKGGGILCGIGTLVDIATALNCSWEYLVAGTEANNMKIFTEKFSRSTGLEEANAKSQAYKLFAKDNETFIDGFNSDDTATTSEEIDEFVGKLEVAQLNNNCTICVGTKLIIGSYKDEMVTCFDEKRTTPVDEYIEHILTEIRACVYNKKQEIIAIYRCYALLLGNMVLSPDGLVSTRIGGELDTYDMDSWRLYNTARVIANWISKNKTLKNYIGKNFGDLEYPCVLTTAAYVRPAYRELGLLGIMRDAICESMNGMGMFLEEEPSTDNWIEVANILPYPFSEMTYDLENYTVDVRDSFTETFEDDESANETQTEHYENDNSTNEAQTPTELLLELLEPKKGKVIIHGKNIHERIVKNQRLAKSMGMHEINCEESYELNESDPVYVKTREDTLERIHYMYYKIPEKLLKEAKLIPSDGLKEEFKEKLNEYIESPESEDIIS